jgi:uncharacterized Zn finger protein
VSQILVLINLDLRFEFKQFDTGCKHAINFFYLTKFTMIEDYIILKLPGRNKKTIFWERNQNSTLIQGI